MLVNTPSNTPHVSASVYLSLISKNAVPPRDIQQVLTAAFAADDYTDCIEDLKKWEIDPQMYIDGLDQVSSHLHTITSNMLTAFPYQIIETLESGTEIYHRSLRALQEACGTYGLLPPSHIVSEQLTLIGKRAYASGGTSDVWKARGEGGRIFAVKTLRVYPEYDDLRLVQKVLRVCNSHRYYLLLENPFSRGIATKSSSLSE